MTSRRFLLIAILLLAFALRLVAIDRIPPGLSHDEAYNGVTAIQVLDGQRLIFFEINKGIEPLIIYLEALAFYAFGIGPVPMRLVNIICGMLTVALAYPLAKRLFNRRVALLAVAGLAISFWAIFTSRLALRAVTLPPLLILTLYLLYRGLDSSRPPQKTSDNPPSSTLHPPSCILHLPSSILHPPSSLLFFALSGLTAGAAMYTYLSSRFVPLLILSIFGYYLLRRRITKWHGLGLLIFFLIWAVIFAPLAYYFLEHTDSFSERSSQVSTIPYLLNGEFGPLARNTLFTLGMFTFHGDDTDRYNLDGRPVFDWLTGLFLYAGLGLALLRLRGSPQAAGPAALILLSAFWMLLPGFITDDSPHFLRTIGAMPAVYILWALGVEAVNRQIGKSVNLPSNPMRPVGPMLHASHFRLHTLLPSFLSLLLLFLTCYDYFGRWANAPEARYIYGADIAEAARYVNATPDQGLAAISAEYYRDLDPFRFTLHSQGEAPFVIWFDGRQSLAFPPPESGLSPRYIFPLSAPPADIWQPFLQPSPAESGQEYSLYHLPEESILRQAQADTFPDANRLGITVNNDLILSAYQVLGTVVSGGKFQVLLGWQALRTLPPDSDYTFLVQLQDVQGNVWAEADGNGYPPGDWQPGVQGLQLLLLRLPGDLPPQTYHLTVQIVDRRSGQALPGTSGESLIPLGTLTGQLARTPRVIDPATLPNPTSTLPASGPGREIALRGYDFNNANAHAGQPLALTLHWQVLQPSAHNYRLQFFLTDEQAGVVYRWPAVAPINGEWPTSQWPADYWVQDRLKLPVESDTPHGQFTLYAAWMGDESPEMTEPSAAFELGRVTVAP